MGHIQSGKTRSFTTVITLARDNGYRLVVVITGMSKPLNRQSSNRLKIDLRLENRRDRKWLILNNPRVDDQYRNIRDTLANWNDTNIGPDRAKTVLITVMKNHTHLQHLVKVMKRLPLDKVPCLVIDDEGDQASLNTLVKEGQESTTYRRILELRSEIPHLSYLQYTATPQAPLLISIVDALSPAFVEVLDPGEDYVGLKEFFVDRKELVRIIPSFELFTHRNPPSGPPDTLSQALCVFFVGAASGYIEEDGTGNRTMLVHPSHRTSLHSLFADWIHQITDSWVEVLEREDKTEEKADLLSSFRAAYDELNNIAKDLPSFDEISTNLLHIIRGTTVSVLNSRNGPSSGPSWYDNYSNILIGGQSVDRGYTVEGLTVTYMPRSVGTGNIDTIQQRARFLGYKKDYLNYCRIFVGRNIRDFYSQNVTHEESVRKELKKHTETGESLQLWCRQLMMPSGMNPTRPNVLSVGYLVGDYSNKWFTTLSLHFDNPVLDTNRNAVVDFLDTIDLVPDEGHPERTDTQRHLCNVDVPLSLVHKELLSRLRFLDHAFTGVRMQIAQYLSNYPNDTCSLYKMSSTLDEWKPRVRELNAKSKIRNLMQGAHPNRHGRIYPGDRKIGDKDRVILQIHKLDLTQDNSSVASEAIGMAIWIPKSLSAGWLIQDQSSQVP